MRNVFFIALILILSSRLFAQQGFVTAGGNAVGAGGSVSFSFGQPFYQSVTSDEGVIIEGLQQPYEIYVVTSVPDMEHLKLLFTVYPNPVSDYLTLQIQDKPASTQNLTFILYDISGKQMLSGPIESAHTLIPTSELIPGTYLLRVGDKSRQLKTFKIIKH